MMHFQQAGAGTGGGRFDPQILARLADAQRRGARVVIDVKSDGHWRQHAAADIDDMDTLADWAEMMVHRRGVEEVALSLEIKDSVGRYVRRRLMHLARDAALRPRAVDRSPLAGFTTDQWDTFIGSWIDQVDAPPARKAQQPLPPAPPTEAALGIRTAPAPEVLAAPAVPAPVPEPARDPVVFEDPAPALNSRFDDLKERPKPFPSLFPRAGSVEMQTAILALGLPALAFALMFGIHLHSLSGGPDFEQIARSMAADAARAAPVRLVHR